MGLNAMILKYICKERMVMVRYGMVPIDWEPRSSVSG